MDAPGDSGGEPRDVPRRAPAAPSAALSGTRLVVIGASAGGVEALQRLVRHVPRSFPAPIVVVLHLPPTAVSHLPEILSRAGPLPARTARDGDHLTRGTIHVAPPNRHVVTADGHLQLVEGPRENGVRPAIDPLFRSAARSYGARLIGGVLSGTLDDGTAGLAAIHAAGGVTFAQDPEDAISPGMPESAIENVPIDHVVRADEIGDLLVDLLRHDRAEARAVPGRHSRPPSRTTDLVCPECGGVLRQFDENGVVRFHCRVGHNYSPETLYDAQDGRLEASLWAAIRALEEQAGLARRLAETARRRGAPRSARRFEDREREAAERADVIRQAILTLSDLEDLPEDAEPEPVSSEDDAGAAHDLDPRAFDGPIDPERLLHDDSAGEDAALEGGAVTDR